MTIFSSIAVYKALYKSFGGFAADVVAAIDQVHMVGFSVSEFGPVGELRSSKKALPYKYYDASMKKIGAMHTMDIMGSVIDIYITIIGLQAAQDGVDIISLSITPNRRPPGIATFFNPIDMALLSAVKAGIFVVQAAGNTGPSPKSMSSFSPWIFTVGAASHDRVYSNSIYLGNDVVIPGAGLARKFVFQLFHFFYCFIISYERS